MQILWKQNTICMCKMWLLLQLPLEEREAGERLIRTISNVYSAFLEKYTQPAIIEQSHRQQLITRKQQEVQRLLTYLARKQNQFATTINAITSFHCMAIILVSVSAIIHKIILQEYRYYYHNKPTIKE
jgi:hypothetical protein